MMDIRGIKAGILAVLLMLFLLPVLARSQDSHPVPENFPILGYENVRGMFKGQSGLLPVSSSTWGRSSTLNVNAFSPNMTDGIDSVYYPADSIAALKGETIYEVEVVARGYGASVTNNTDNDYVGSDTTLTLKIHKMSVEVDSTANHVVWKNNANRRVIDNLGFTFESTVAVGDKFVVAITYDVPVGADDSLEALKAYDPRITLTNGAIPTFNAAYIDSATLATYDTLVTTTDTVYSTVVSGNYGSAALYIESISKTGTATIFGVGKQLKYNGAAGWFGDPAVADQRLFLLDDSVYMAPTDSFAVVRDTVSVPADSARYIFYSKSALRAILKRVKALLRKD